MNITNLLLIDEARERLPAISVVLWGSLFRSSWEDRACGESTRATQPSRLRMYALQRNIVKNPTSA